MNENKGKKQDWTIFCPHINMKAIFQNAKNSTTNDCTNLFLTYQKDRTTIPPIHVCINKINNKLVFQMKNGYKLELKTHETIKLFGSS